MKRNHLVLVLVGGAVLVLGFVIASISYTSEQADKIEQVAKSPSSPLLRDYSQTYGPPDAKVVIVEFFDPGCEACRVFAPRVKALIAARPGKVRLVLKYAPFHDGADKMVQILEAARLQGKYWETLQVMYERQPEWANHHHPQPEKIWRFLPAAGVDLAKIRSDMNKPEILEIIRQDLADAKALNVRKTPGFFVNGRPLATFGWRQLVSLVDTEIFAAYAP